MKKVELPSRYEHLQVESKWYQLWEKENAFSPEFAKKLNRLEFKGPYSIVIPPPNVTGQLHVGHALNMTIQDVLIRLARKMGYQTLWIPGTDHAGIATQSRVERELKEKENKTRWDLGREAFLERVWQWKEHYGNVITQQMRKLGVSVDWGRERFTMDEGLSYAVRKVFVDLYKQGLIYRDTKMVNWDPETKTVLSDLEVEYEENYKGELWSFAYPLVDGGGEIVVATTRPETMLGDTAIAVHPDDERYKHLIGKKVKHPLLGREIPIIADAILVDPQFGTGAVKVTPAHDPNDFEVGKRHQLEFINIFDESARINENGGPYKGLDRFEARKKIKEDIAKLGLDRGTKEHIMSIGRSQRSNAIVEPMISTQWFVKVEPLAKKAIEYVEQEKIKFIPKRWENLYFSWMHQIKDWCISRQLWWGHQIPAWYCKDCGHISVSMEDLTSCESCHSKNIERDPDVLDTWFSSALWPFSTMGWPEDTDDLKTYYPTRVLVTGFDIIFFWVARMIMMGVHFIGKEPFKDVYIHGLMRDEKGRKISKSMGNNVDPVEIIKTYGADSYRYFFMATLTEGKDLVYSEQRLKGYQNFCNKIWNSARFVFLNLPEDFQLDFSRLYQLDLALENEDYWILYHLHRVENIVQNLLHSYKFHIVSEELYEFIWNYYCDWYIEIVKPRLKKDSDKKESALYVLVYVLYQILNLLHPFMPFLTEELFSYLKPFLSKKDVPFLMWELYDFEIKKWEVSSWKDKISYLDDLKELITKTRSIRADLSIPPSRKIQVRIFTEDPNFQNYIESKKEAVLRLIQAEEITFIQEKTIDSQTIVEVLRTGFMEVPLKGVVNLQSELQKLQKEKQELEKIITIADSKLNNEKFIKSAPEQVIEEQRHKKEEAIERLQYVNQTIEKLLKIQ
ncbi:MAG: valine--tRNA ligase [Leptospiraceae bacterium]|nr:valine--tRNA ligase [Leptospiraceae bacterium]MDW7975466.1 valine--tRNA ligase [Leptospiraceae bacterium]